MLLHTALRRRSPPLYCLAGLPLLYASAYFLPLLLPMGAYLLPSHDLLGVVGLPTAVAVVVGDGLLCAFWAAARRWDDPRVWSPVAIVAVTLLSLIGVQSMLESAGFHWQDRVPRGEDLAMTQQVIRFVVACAVLAAVWAGRRFLSQVVRLLSSLGLAFGAIAIFRVVVLLHSPEARSSDAAPPLSASASLRSHSLASAPVSARPPLSRRVVWVIFDETDFGFVYGDDSASSHFENFEKLRRIGVFASHANSPASATLYSIPALLTGVPADGVTLSPGGTLALRQKAGPDIPFLEDTSIFGALAEHGFGASVLGFFHPYCKLFTLTECDSFAWPRAGGWADALWSNVPASIAKRLGHTDGWGRVTQDALALLPHYIARGDALTFVHLNLPHLPAVFADEQLHVTASTDPLVEYSRNLALADLTLGKILNQLEVQQPIRDVLLVVSADHWLRNRWYRASTPEVSRPIPLIMWKVGETHGLVLSEPVSTVHTAAMILDYLGGAIDSQADIAGWWARQAVTPAFIGPNT